MRFIFFTHSLASDWNHGNAHFQRGVMRELIARGHEAVAFEPADGWSRCNLVADQGPQAIEAFHARFPELETRTYPDAAALDLDATLDGADVVVVHEWTDPRLVAAVGAHRRRGGRYRLLFHDTHHRAVSAGSDIAELDLEGYDGVLAFGEVLSELYRARGWGRQVFTWHEAADTRLFRPLPKIAPVRDLIWVGNWGDGERSRELRSYLVEPVAAAGMLATVHGVRYPAEALHGLAAAGIRHDGWLANAAVPEAFARHRCTIHVPRRPYVQQLPGIPTIRVFEALACGIPLVCAPWDDAEGLFRPGEDYLLARSPRHMRDQLRRVLYEPGLAASLRARGLARIRARHTCGHRVTELLAIVSRLSAPPAAARPAEAAA